MAEVERLVVTLVGDASGLVGPLRTAEAQLRGFGASAQAAAGGALGRLGAAAGAAGAAVGGAGAALAGASVKAFAAFDEAMTKSTSIMGDLTAEQTRQLRNLAIELSTTTPRSAAELAAAYYHLASAGLDASQAMAALPVVSRFATAGAVSVEQATELLASSQQALGMASKDAAVHQANLARIADVLTNANNAALGSATSYARALSRDSAAVMRQFNISLEDGVAILAAYHQQNIQGEAAGNLFGRMVRLLTASAVKNAAAFERLGVKVFDAQGNMMPVIDIIDGLQAALGPMNEQGRVAALNFLGMRTLSQKAITPLLGMGQSIRDVRGKLEETNSTQRVAEKQSASFNNQIKILTNNVTAAAIELGERLAPAVLEVAGWVKKAIDWWRGLGEETQNSALAGGALAAGLAAATGVILAAKAAAAAFGAALLPVLAAMGLVAGGGYLITQRLGGVGATWEIIKGKGLEAWDFLKAKTLEFLAFMRPVGQALWSLMNAAWERVRQGAAALWDYVRQGFTSLKDWLAQALGGADVDWTAVRDGVVDAVLTAEFALRNFQEVADVAWLQAQAGAAAFANQVVFFFYEYIPAAITWFGDNLSGILDNVIGYGVALWRSYALNVKEVFEALLPWLIDNWIAANNALLKVLENLGGNVVNLFQNLPKIIKGGMSFEDVWLPLTQGLETEFRRLNLRLTPLADGFQRRALGAFTPPTRQVGAWEQGLADQAAAAARAAGMSLEEFKRARKAAFAAAGEAPQANWVDEWFGSQTSWLDDWFNSTAGKAAAAGAKTGMAFANKAGKEMQKVEAVGFGTAEALARVTAQAEATGGFGGLRGWDPRRGAFAGSGDRQVDLLRDIRDELRRRGPQVELDDADLEA